MGYGWDMDGIWMGYGWDTDEIWMGYGWDMDVIYIYIFHSNEVEGCGD